MEMPIGKFKGEQVEAMTTVYLAWLVTNDHLRFKHWPLICAALGVLRSRFERFEALLAELQVEAPPPAFWKTKEKIEQRKAEKAEKLRQLEVRRAVEREQRREERRAQRLKAQMEATADYLRGCRARYDARRQEDSGSVIDAGYAARGKRQPKPSDPNDISDLV